MEKLNDTFFRGAEDPSMGMFAFLGFSVLLAVYAAWARARERSWIESAVAGAVAVIGLGEILLLLTSGNVARLDRIVVLATVLMATGLLIEDIRNNGPAAEGWRHLRAALRL